MEDNDIVKLFLDRQESALTAASEKYRSYIQAIAVNILDSREDAEELFNDTLMKAWELIPPHRPKALSAFLGKITRNLAINRLRMRMSEKRGSGEVSLVYEELSDMISGSSDVEGSAERAELIAEINAFLKSRPKRQRDIFICRYWYCDSIRQIAARYGLTESNVSVILTRTRQKLLAHLQKRGFEI